VVVEGEQGRVEDIRLSYVVMRTGDERRLIVPTVKFLDTTFQNWTRVGGITGSGLPIRPVLRLTPSDRPFAPLWPTCPRGINVPVIWLYQNRVLARSN
jgi:hypothetical protein